MGASMNMSAVAFDVAWSAAALGDLPTPLSVPAWGPTMAQRRQLEEQAWNELHRCGLAHGRELSQSTQQALRVLGDASVELYGYFGPEEQPPMSVMAAARGDVAVLACVHQNRYDITQIWPSALAESVAATLPMLGQGPGQALNASERAARGPTQDSGSILQPVGAGSANAAAGERIRRVLSQPRLGVGQFHCARRDRHGKRTRDPVMLAVLDTTNGRYVLERRGLSSPEPWLIVSPADLTVLTRALHTLLSGPQ